MKPGKYINNFLVGADPEFVLMNPPSLVRGLRGLRTAGSGQSGRTEARMWGFDHDGWVLESHPRPSLSTVEVIKNIRASMNQIGRCFGDTHKWRAGAFIEAPERNIGLGGHIHIDLPRIPNGALYGMDHLTTWFEALDILPRNECHARRNTTPYGRLSDVRVERGRFEFRSMCSWLFSQRVSMLCLTAIKLVNAAPESWQTLGSPSQASVKKLEDWFALFKGKDDDVDRMFAKDYFTKKLTYNPDRDLKNTWVVDPTNMKGVEFLAQAA